MKIFPITIFRKETERYKVLAEMILDLESRLSHNAPDLIQEPHKQKLYMELSMRNDVITCVVNHKVTLTKSNAMPSDYKRILDATSLDAIFLVFDYNEPY